MESWFILLPRLASVSAPGLSDKIAKHENLIFSLKYDTTGQMKAGFCDCGIAVRYDLVVYLIITYDCCLKDLVQTPQGIYPPPPRAGAKTFLEPTLNFDRTYVCSAIEHNINNWKETCQSTGTLVQKWPRTVSEFLPTP